MGYYTRDMKRLFYLLNVPAAYAVVSGALFGPLSADIRLLQWAVPLEHNRLGTLLHPCLIEGGREERLPR